jgi:hypothetical protein
VDHVIATGTGFAIGVAGAFVVAILQITGKRLRNARLERRGEPPIRDVILTPFWLLFGIVGAASGGAASTLGRTLPDCVFVAAAFPALWIALALVYVLAQLRP